MKTKLFIPLLLVSACLATTSCNTFYGIGKDMQKLGGLMTKNAPNRSTSATAPRYQAPASQDPVYGPADYPPPR